MAPKYLCQKFLKMGTTCNTKGSSPIFQQPLPKTNDSQTVALRTPRYYGHPANTDSCWIPIKK